MNIYFLVEGAETETKVYPKWLEYLLPSLKRVKEAHQVTQNSYVLLPGCGFPLLLTTLYKNSVEEINEIGSFDYFVLCIDTEGFSVENRREYIEEYIETNKIKLTERTQMIIIFQNKCIETWFLGNTEIYSDNPRNKQLQEYCSLYNVKESDPELMPSLKENISVGKFHKRYLSLMLQEKNIRYSKKNTEYIENKTYLDQLIKRLEETNHLQSFKTLIDFCRTVAQQSQTTTQQ